ncbi:hypothetical protein QQG55_40465 [Brugia pahangi]|uniref:Uncharacterized protein n=1 Tax=Brugia pahangi TaxID=6280 RepID=A0A0N4TXQ7_BRUPA|nr:unnamed protein product [Brugia pahangi]
MSPLTYVLYIRGAVTVHAKERITNAVTFCQQYLCHNGCHIPQKASSRSIHLFRYQSSVSKNVLGGLV